ncbi:acyltransferase family protein [Microbacterium pumilum]|uniref:acyltransferase family protein n=1 Tax=Microbacterium pumilum TaxID=344165 RepID=UPI0031D0C02C
MTRAQLRAASPRRSPQRIREIDGLRGVALTMVVLFHLFGHGRVSGGVDVFLVVSGFLITMSLASSVHAGRSLDLARRWGRIFTRLAPAAAVTLVFVLLLTMTVLPPWTREQNLGEVIASALYVENWQLISSQLAYNAAGPLTSPVQHFWSLAIQAQFFIALPLAVALIVRIARSPAASLRIVWIVLGIATGASFLYAAWLNGTSPDIAYFSSFTRLWELGLGALMAGLVLRGLRLPGVLGAVAGWIGLALVVGSGWFVDGAQAFPGPLALIPVLGAALVIAASGGRSRGSVATVLGARPLVALDRVSYPLYLWHWPILIAFLAIVGRDTVGVMDAVIILSISILAALATRRFVSRPVEQWAFARPRSQASLITPVVAIGTVVVLAFALLIPQTAAAREEDWDAASPCFGAAAMDPAQAACADAVPTELVPGFAALSKDDDNRSGCWASDGMKEVHVCTLGVEEGYSRHLIAVGDSHNNTLIGAYARIALENGWRIDVAGRGGCYWTTATQRQSSPVEADECRNWTADLTARIQAMPDLDAIIVTHSSAAPLSVPEGADADEYRVQGLVEAWSTRPAGVPIIAIRDNPIFPKSALECALDVDTALRGGCAVPRDEALHDDGTREAVARDANATLIDLTDYMCAPAQCSIAVGGVLVVRDGRHLTATFAHTLAPYLSRALVEALD